MLTIAMGVTLGMLAVAFLLVAAALFLRRGLADRILALDTLYVNAVALIVVLGLFEHTEGYFEAALLIAALGFVSTVALCKYVLRGDLIE